MRKGRPWKSRETPEDGNISSQEKEAEEEGKHIPPLQMFPTTGWERRRTGAPRQHDRMQAPAGRRINLNGISQHRLFLFFPRFFLFYLLLLLLLLPFHPYLLPFFFFFISLSLSLAAPPPPRLMLSESKKGGRVNLPLGTTPKCPFFPLIFFLLSFQCVTSILQKHRG